MRLKLALALTLTFLFPFLSQSAFAAATPLRGWVLENSDYPNHQGLIFFFDHLKQQSNGRYEGQVLWRQDLGAQKEVLPKFKAGEVDFAVISNAGLMEVVPEMEVLSLPFIFRNQEHMLSVLDSDIGKDLEGMLAKKGFIVLAWYNGGSRSFYTKSKPLAYGTDMRGMRMRVANRESMISMVKTLGGVPSTIAFDKVADAFKSGELDAAENDVLSYEISEHYKFAPNFVISHHNVLPEALVVSTQRWAAMPETDRNLVRQVAQDSATYMRKQRAQLEAKVRGRLEKNGVKFSVLKGTDGFVSRMKEAYAPVLKSQAATDLMFRIMTSKN